jgi:hypothetical protein
MTRSAMVRYSRSRNRPRQLLHEELDDNPIRFEPHLDPFLHFLVWMIGWGQIAQGHERFDQPLEPRTKFDGGRLARETPDNSCHSVLPRGRFHGLSVAKLRHHRKLVVVEGDRHELALVVEPHDLAEAMTSSLAVYG